MGKHDLELAILRAAGIDDPDKQNIIGFTLEASTDGLPLLTVTQRLWDSKSSDVEQVASDYVLVCARCMGAEVVDAVEDHRLGETDPCPQCSN